MLLIYDTDYRNLRMKGYTHTLIEELMKYNPNRILDLLRDPWSYPVLGDRSAPVEKNEPINRNTALTFTSNSDEQPDEIMVEEPSEK